MYNNNRRISAVTAEIEKGFLDLLIIDPCATGADAVELCSEIRKTHTMLSFPVLMIAEPYAWYLIRQGYAAGVNDFVIRPFGAAELVTRVYSLLNIKKVDDKNINLEKSDHEKQAYLYFLTHNINTPLTLLSYLLYWPLSVRFRCFLRDTDA
jgi:DNA-binding response OmpR family regulator